MLTESEAPAVIEDYYGDTTHVSRSMLEDFLVSPALYHGRYVAKTIAPREESASMRFGSAVHSLVLGGPHVLAAPKCDRRSNAGKQLWAEFEAESAGCIVLDRDDYDCANRCADNVKAHDIAAEILAGVEAHEIVRTVEHVESALPLKSKLDLIGNWMGSRLIGDLKTAGKPWPEIWPKTLPNYGYHRQAAFYLLHDPAAKWAWIVVGSEPPHEVFVYEPDQTTLDIGRGEIDAALMRLADCMRSGVWEHPQSGLMNRASLPRWYMERGLSHVECDW